MKDEGTLVSNENSVFVVEDDRDIQSFLDILLSGEGYNVQLTSDGQQALAKLRNLKPGLILLDLTLPGMSGSEFAQEVRRQFGSDIPIIIMSAGADLNAIAKQIGANDFITKPFDVEDLLNMVKKWLS